MRSVGSVGTGGQHSVIGTDTRVITVGAPNPSPMRNLSPGTSQTL